MDFPGTPDAYALGSRIYGGATPFFNIVEPLAGFGYGSISMTWPATNQAYYIPFRIHRPVIVTRLGWINQTTVAGNVDAGIYDQAQNKIISTGSVVQTGSALTQIVNITDTLLTTGYYWAAMASSSGTAQFGGAQPSSLAARIMGALTQATAFPLPASMTPVNLSTAPVTRLPYILWMFNSV